MFTVQPADIERLRSPGGDRFASFVNDLIRAHSLACGLPASVVHLNQQTTIGDGGVDAEVTSAAPRDPDGWLKYPTVWQFKASQARDIGPTQLIREMQKPEVRQRVAEGFLYYACISAQLTAPMRRDREAALKRAAEEINSNAPVPHLLDANDLAALASRYPAVVLRHFRPGIEELCLSLDAWGRSAVGQTPHFVSTPELDEARLRIESHLSFTSTPRDAVLVVRGEAGIGKTRLVYEAVRHAPNAEVMAIFANDETAALRLATTAINAPQTMFLVMDEATARGIAQANAILDGHRDRVRIVAIESTEQDYRREDDEALWIREISNIELDEILDSNFKEVAQTRRRAYAYLAAGSIRFAVELCRRDAEIDVNVGLPRAAFVREYVSRLLGADERDAVEAVALVYGIGWRDEAADELHRLCQLLKLDENRVRQSAARIRNAPGFIATAGRYCYIKPPIVAQVAFDDAWRRWAEHNDHAFLEGIASSGLLRPFLHQVGRVASRDVRDRVGTFRKSWGEALAPEILGNGDETDQLLALIEVDPHQFFPIFRRLVEQSDDDLLTEAPTWAPNIREAKHKFVTTARRFSNRPKHFHDAEAILLRLALSESKPRISPNATGQYRQLFRIFLSGTHLSFSERLSILKTRVCSDDIQVALIAVSALCNILDRRHYRGVDEPIVGGFIAEEDWQPQTYADWYMCLTTVLDELQKIVDSESDAIREHVWDGVLPHLRELIGSGYLSSFVSLFPADRLKSPFRERVICELNAYLDLLDDAEDDVERRKLISVQDEEEIQSFAASLKPNDLDGRLALALATDPWRARSLDPSSPWRAEVRSLSVEFVRDPKWFIEVKDRLFSPSIQTAHQIGLELGDQDQTGVLLDIVLDTALDMPLNYLPLGYIKGLTDRSAIHNGRISQFLDKAEVVAPLVAFYLAASAGDGCDALERMLHLVDKGRVPASHLGTLVQGLNGRHLNSEEFERVMTRLVEVAESGQNEAATWGLQLFRVRLSEANPRIDAEAELLQSHLRDLAWRLVETMATDPWEESSAWAKVFETLAPTDTQRATEVAANALASGKTDFLSIASQVMVTIARSEPATVMAALGRVMLDDDKRFSFSGHSHPEIFEALPIGTVEAWIKTSGIAGAIELAWHLPLLRLTPAGHPEVPALTETVLDRFGNNSEVLERFCRATLSNSRIMFEDQNETMVRHRAVADIARKFEQHPNPIIRAWSCKVLELEGDRERWIKGNIQEDTERRFRPIGR